LAQQNSRGQTNPRANPSVDSSRNSKGSGLTNGNSAAKSASPAPSPSSILSPNTSASYPTLSTAKPVASLSPNPTVNSSAPSGSQRFESWKRGGKSVVLWMSANRLATLLGVLILLSLVLYLVLALRRRGKGGSKLKRKKVKVQPKVQPKVEPTPSPDMEMNEGADAAWLVSPSSANQPSEFIKEPAIAPPVAVAAVPHHSWGPTKASVSSPTAGPDEFSSEEEEREVFEL
jgi:hypothetical protein